MSDFIEGCTICGEDLDAGDNVYATMDGEIRFLFMGCRKVFEPSDGIPITIACESCGVKCSEAIANISKKDTRPDRERELLAALREALQAISDGRKMKGWPEAMRLAGG